MKFYSCEKNEILTSYSPRPTGIAFSDESVFKYAKPTLDLSVIVPCFNAQDYLKECIDSLIKQKTKYKFEILIINDGSTDNTEKILDEYTRKYSYIKVITQENKGFSGARNTGICESLGKYLMFIDSDDYITEDYFENLLKVAMKERADLVACGYYSFKGNYIYKRIIPQGDKDKTLLNGCFWGKIFKRDLFEHITLPEGYWYEDTILAHLIYPKINIFRSVTGCFYAYRQNPNGITISSRKNPKALDTFYITELMIKSITNILPEEYIYSQHYYEILLEQLYLNQCRLEKLPKNIKKIVFNLQSQFICENYGDFNTTSKVKKGYEFTLKKNMYKKAVIHIKLSKIYKIINLLKRK